MTGLVLPVIVDHGEDSLEYMDELDAIWPLNEPLYSSNGMPGGVVGWQWAYSKDMVRQCQRQKHCSRKDDAYSSVLSHNERV